jgi:hypothetical protein
MLHLVSPGQTQLHTRRMEIMLHCVLGVTKWISNVYQNEWNDKCFNRLLPRENKGNRSSQKPVGPLVNTENTEKVIYSTRVHVNR